MRANRRYTNTIIPAKKVDIELNLNGMNEHQNENIYQLEFKWTKETFWCELVFVRVCVCMHLDAIHVMRRNKEMNKNFSNRNSKNWT